MIQDQLWHESPEDALRSLIDRLGGFKKVGHALWPAMPIADASRKLMHCTDPERDHKLSLGELCALLAMGQKVGCHVAMRFLSQCAGYQDPQPIDPESELQRLEKAMADHMTGLRSLQRQFEDTVGRLHGVARNA